MSPSSAARFLRIAAAASFGLSLIFAAAAFASLDGGSRLMFDLLDWPFGDGLGAYTQEARWFAAIGGGLWASLSVIYYLVIAPAIERGDGEARRGGIIAIIVWFVIDSAGSVAAGVPSNALFNVPFLALFLMPLLAVKTAAGAAARPA